MIELYPFLLQLLNANVGYIERLLRNTSEDKDTYKPIVLVILHYALLIEEGKT